MGISEMFLEVLDTDVTHPTLHHLHHRQRVRLQAAPQLPDAVQVFLPVDAVDVLEVSVDRVAVILDHLPAHLALEWLRFCLTTTVLVLVVPVADVVLVLDVTIEGSVVVEHLRTESAVEQTGRPSGQHDLLIGGVVGLLQLLGLLVPVPQLEVEVELVILLENLVAAEVALKVCGEMLHLVDLLFLDFLLLTGTTGSWWGWSNLSLQEAGILFKNVLLDNLHLRSLSVAEFLHVLFLSQLVTDLEMPLEVHALSLTDSAGVDLPLRQVLGDVLPPGLLGDQSLVDVLVQLVFLVEMLSLVLHTDATDDTLKQL